MADKKSRGQAENPQTRLCSYTKDAVFYGSDNLVNDLLGKATFIDVFLKQLLGRLPTAAERVVIDAVLVTLMEHGMTPSAIATRMIYSSSPENLQAGVAAGLLAVASRFVGTMEPAAEILNRIVMSGEGASEVAKEIAQSYRQRREPVPGFGHHLHSPDDPRALALLVLAREQGLYGAQCRALEKLSLEIDAAAGRHITINATGAIAALLGEIGIPNGLMRGFAVLARCAGLITHIAEEQRDPSGRFIWAAIDEAMTNQTVAN